MMYAFAASIVAAFSVSFDSAAGTLVEQVVL
jgi:hypothetical protein